MNMSSVEHRKIKNFQYAHFIMPIYKYPLATLSTIFFPLWMLGIINIGIFFQDEVLGKRFLNIAALMIAYVALIPTIRDEVPPS